jgi:hypothetical protein
MLYGWLQVTKDMVNKPVIYCVDIDGTLCSQRNGDYENAQPWPARIAVVNKLFNEGHRIILYTARGSGTGIDWRDVTEAQLRAWSVSHHELWFGKPPADYYIDDRAVTADLWFENYTAQTGGER